MVKIWATNCVRGAWTVLLNGKALKGWNVVGDANWTVADGAVQAD